MILHACTSDGLKLSAQPCSQANVYRHQEAASVVWEVSLKKIAAVIKMKMYSYSEF